MFVILFIFLPTNSHVALKYRYFDLKSFDSRKTSWGSSSCGRSCLVYEGKVWKQSYIIYRLRVLHINYATAIASSFEGIVLLLPSCNGPPFTFKMWSITMHKLNYTVLFKKWHYSNCWFILSRYWRWRAVHLASRNRSMHTLQSPLSPDTSVSNLTRVLLTSFLIKNTKTKI